MTIYDKIVIVTDNELRCKSIVDLIDKYNCKFEYVASDACGYCKFANTDDVDNFYSDLCELKNSLFLLQCCYDKKLKDKRRFVMLQHKYKIFQDDNKGYMVAVFIPAADTGYYKQVSKWYKYKKNLVRFFRANLSAGVKWMI